MKTIINLTQHNITAEQAAQGVVDLPAEERARLIKFLNFDTIPSKEELYDRALAIAIMVHCMDEDYEFAMIGGAPFFMSILEKKLKEYDIQPMYAFSERVSVDVPQEDGSVIKTSKFQHIGFVKV